MRETRIADTIKCAQHAHIGGRAMIEEPSAAAPDIAVLADDLSGAAEAAAAFLGRETTLCLRLNAFRLLGSTGVVVADLNTRAMTSQGASCTVRAALSGIPSGTRAVKKIDSLLRGHIGAEVAVLGERGPVIVAAALPALARTVRDGVLYLDETPLHETRAWAAEAAPPPLAVADLFGDLRVAMVGTGDGVADALTRASAEGRIAICDTATDADLDAIVSAAPSGAQLVGTSALAAAVARTLPPGRRQTYGRPPSKKVLTVVGTAAPVVTGQVAALITNGAEAVTIDARALLHDKADPEPVQRALAHGSAVVTISGVVEPSEGQATSAALGHFIAAAEGDDRPDLVLTGGQTARAVIDAIGLTTLRPIHEIHRGAVASVASDGRCVVTRPGSFGAAESLVAIVRYLTQRNEDNS
jgi:uncharacterized protein YgbK (DUF1537 family)